jgi:hypothetical protein
VYVMMQEMRSVCACVFIIISESLFTLYVQEQLFVKHMLAIKMLYINGQDSEIFHLYD